MKFDLRYPTLEDNQIRKSLTGLELLSSHCKRFGTFAGQLFKGMIERTLVWISKHECHLAYGNIRTGKLVNGNLFTNSLNKFPETCVFVFKLFMKRALAECKITGNSINQRCAAFQYSLANETGDPAGPFFVRGNVRPCWFCDHTRLAECDKQKMPNMVTASLQWT